MSVKKSISVFLEKNNLAYELFTHEAYHSVEETLGAYEKMGIPENKSLFLRDAKKRRFFLVVIEGNKSAKLDELADFFGEKRLSFASEKYLEKYLKTKPGSVSPLGLIFPESCEIEVLVDEDLLNNKYGFIGFHPNNNTETWKMKNEDFKRFLDILSRDLKESVLIEKL